MKSIRFILSSLLLTCFLSAGIYGQQSAKEIMLKTRDVSKIPGLETVATLKIIDPKGRERVREISMASKLTDNGKTEKRIIRFLAPAEVKGTGMLIYDYDATADDMWIYMPALRKTRRIASGEKNQSFMGSEFSNADLAAPNTDDFSYKITGSETVDGVDCWKIESLPLTQAIADDAGISRKTIWVGKKDYVCRKTEFYDPEGELSKILTCSDVRKMAEGKYMAASLQMENVQNGRKSSFTMDQMQYNPNVKEANFTVAYLEKL
jgi:Outer membrane lipoprotein-sorting protein